VEQEITVDNWVEALEKFLYPEHDQLTATVREHLSIEGQSAMRTLRDQLPRMTVHTVEEEDDD